MHILKLNVSEGVYDKLIWFLHRFDKTEVEIIQDEPTFIVNKEYLNNELSRIKSNNAVFVSRDELIKSIDEAISKYEH
jgi:hypothetical protein